MTFTKGNLILVNYSGSPGREANPLQEFTRSPDPASPVQTFITDISDVNVTGSALPAQDLWPVYVTQNGANGNLLVTGQFNDIIEIEPDGTLSVYFSRADIEAALPDFDTVWAMRVDNSGRLCIAYGSSLKVARFKPDKSLDSTMVPGDFSEALGRTWPCISPDGESVAYVTFGGDLNLPTFWQNGTAIFTATEGNVIRTSQSAAVGFSPTGDVICIYGQADEADDTVTTRYRTWMQRFGASPGGPYLLTDVTKPSAQDETPISYGFVADDGFGGGDACWVSRWTDDLIADGDPDPCGDGSMHDFSLCKLNVSTGEIEGTFTFESPCAAQEFVFPWVYGPHPPTYPGLALYPGAGLAATWGPSLP